MDSKSRALLYRSFDEDLTSEELEALDRALARSAALRRERAELIRLRDALHRGRASGFVAGFEGRVLRAIRTSPHAQDDFSAALSWAFRRIAVAATVAAVMLLVHNCYQEGTVSWDGALRMPRVSMENLWEYAE